VSTIAPTEPMTMPAAPASASVLIEGGDQRSLFPGVDWHTYRQLSEATGEGQPIRLIYDGKDLEIMVTGNVHERFKELLGMIVKAIAMGRDLDYLSCGQTTWRTLIRGLEADLSYYFDPEKVRMAQGALARGSKDPAEYPRPDLAIEIDMSPPQVDRPAIYSDLGVAEVWRLVRGQELIIELRQADGSYAQAEESRFLGIRAEEILRWLNAAATEREAAWNRRLNQWAMGLGRQA
jgi:Uma2 family endonuclease